MNTTAFSHFTPNHSQAYIALFRNVSNASDIKTRIISAAAAEGDAGEKEREAVNFAFIDARLVRTSYSCSRTRAEMLYVR
jgi:EKC/KEOPS complex subunit CGI121/TPRKB